MKPPYIISTGKEIPEPTASHAEPEFVSASSFKETVMQLRHSLSILVLLAFLYSSGWSEPNAAATLSVSVSDLGGTSGTGSNSQCLL